MDLKKFLKAYIKPMESKSSPSQPSTTVLLTWLMKLTKLPELTPPQMTAKLRPKIKQRELLRRELLLMTRELKMTKQLKLLKMLKLLAAWTNATLPQDLSCEQRSDANQSSNHTATPNQQVIASERPTERPVLRGLLQETANKPTSNLKKHVLLLEDKLKAASWNRPRKLWQKQEGWWYEISKEHPMEEEQTRHLKSDAQEEEETCQGCNHSRRQQQHHRVWQQKEATKEALCLIWVEEGRARRQLVQIKLIAERETQESYGFLPNPKISIHLNAHQVLEDTPPDVYFSHFTNKTFHDLTPGKSLPAAAKYLLGFRLKLIPVPKKLLWLIDINEGVDCFNQDMFLKFHFAGDDNEDDKRPYKKLQVKSTWKPDQPPCKILSRLSAFSSAMGRQFTPQMWKVEPNHVSSWNSWENLYKQECDNRSRGQEHWSCWSGCQAIH